jgi:hypothetical protein
MSKLTHGIALAVGILAGGGWVHLCSQETATAADGSVTDARAQSNSPPEPSTSSARQEDVRVQPSQALPASAEAPNMKDYEPALHAMQRLLEASQDGGVPDGT